MNIFNGTKLAFSGVVGKVNGYLDKQFTSTQFSHNQIFSMLGPLILDQFFIFFIGMLTASMISASSQQSVAAVSLVNPLGFFVMAVFFAVSAGGSVIVAQYKGKGDQKLMRRAAGQVILSTAVVATFFSVLLIIFADPLIHFIYGGGENPTDPQVLEKAINYLVGLSYSLPTLAIYHGVFSVLRGVGATKVCLRLTVIINVIHLVASMLFLNVLKLDIFGTALSYNLARIIGCVISVMIIFSPKSAFFLSLRHIFTFRWSIQKSIMKMGVPFAIEQLFLNGGTILSQMYMIKLGTIAIAANSIAASASNLFYGAGLGVATLSITLIGQCIGAGDIELAKKYGRKLIFLGTAVMIAAIAIIYPLMPFILRLFEPAPETLPIIKQIILIGIIPIPFFWPVSNIMPSILRAAGDANFTSWVSLSSMWLCRVGLGYLLAIPLGFGVHGIWVALGVEWALRSLLFIIRFKGKKWYSRKVV